MRSECRLGARAVVALEAAVDDRARYRLAARAAERALGGEQKKMPAGTCNRQAAVETGGAQDTVMRRPAPFDFFGSTSFSTPSLY
jgi:hypothetical protein